MIVVLDSVCEVNGSGLAQKVISYAIVPRLSRVHGNVSPGILMSEERPLNTFWNTYMVVKLYCGHCEGLGWVIYRFLLLTFCLTGLQFLSCCLYLPVCIELPLT